MRRITLPTPTEDFDAREILKAQVSFAPERGYSVNDIRRALRVLAALDGQERLVLENDDWTFLNDRVSNARWGRATAELLTLIESISNAIDEPGK